MLYEFLSGFDFYQLNCCTKNVTVIVLMTKIYFLMHCHIPPLNNLGFTFLVYKWKTSSLALLCCSPVVYLREHLHQHTLIDLQGKGHFLQIYFFVFVCDLYISNYLNVDLSLPTRKDVSGARLILYLETTKTSRLKCNWPTPVSILMNSTTTCRLINCFHLSL